MTSLEPLPAGLPNSARLAAQVSPPEVLEFLARALERRLTGGEILLLFEEAALHDLGRVAHQLRVCRSDPDLVTYVIDRNVTHPAQCYTDCLFCARDRRLDDSETPFPNTDEILAKVRTVFETGGTQILLQGGLHHHWDVGASEDMLRRIKSAFPGIWIHGFSPPEIEQSARFSRQTTRTVIERLAAAGLDSLPGGGAEILNDRVRRRLATSKMSAAAWLGIMEEAHSLGLPTNATMMFGHIETLPERVEHLLRVRESQDRTGGYTAFIPWTAQPADPHTARERPDLMAQVATRPYQGALDYLRTLAICRIALDNFRNVQASWVTQGKAIGQLTLCYGANDLGSTMMAESDVSGVGAGHPLTRRDLDEMIRGAGFTPAQRDNGYNVLSRESRSR